MTAIIPKSKIASMDRFEVRVAGHAQLVREWRAHMAKVDDDEKDNVPDEKRHVAYKAPREHSMVEDAVDAEGNADYRIQDDGPTPAQLLDARKQQLFAEAVAMEHEAQTAIDGAPLKARIRAVMMSRIRAEDGARLQPLLDQLSNLSVVDKVMLKGKPLREALADPEKNVHAGNRPVADQQFLDSRATAETKLAAMREHFAQVLADIDDLTVATARTYKIPEFTA